ncbi:L-serine ammonia-lyase, iron-sulfur-dependent subunit beta [Clostridium polynesiense]|uniref:L-serine ammonia-lyase, iron-sulfur-dependent subunit beta n=1 Tax=Clostridium polynesiense TaxID=1325933 RepID=UPI00058E7525|nr:L-serine ammonia-lyase, iron-sulfur-dependent subunit beta [Clostridium polynesiense]
MKKYGVFEVLGPIMIGPSSSHTAGAARLGKIAGTIAGGKITKVDFLLHGSFGKTYKGHGTDRALVAGILGMEPSDERLRDALTIAKEKGIEVNFIEEDLGDVHPNTVKFIIKCQGGGEVTVMGSSIGGGNIQITEVDGDKVQFTGAYPTLIISHRDVPGQVSKVTTLLYEENINIAFMKVFRNHRGTIATMVFETDHSIPEEVLSKINSISEIARVTYISPVKDGEA